MEGETAQIKIEIKNSRAFTWHPDDNVELRKLTGVQLAPKGESLPLPEATAPGETAVWTYDVDTRGMVAIERFRMVQKGEPFGPDVAVIVVGVPQKWADRRDEVEQKIQELIDDWKARGEEKLDALIQEIKEQVRRELEKS